MAKHRSGRINEEMKKVISSIIQKDIKDPRLTAMISVTSVEVTKDLGYAKVYVSIFGSEKSKEESLEALKSSVGFIRKEVGKKIKLRCTPQIIIEVDRSLEIGSKIDSILSKIKETTKNDNE